MKRRVLYLLAILVFSIIMLSATAMAASYPSMYPDEYNYTATQGEVVEIKFTIFHEFTNEKAHVRVHQGSRTGTVVASSDRDFYNVNYMTEYTVSWDTSDVQPGKYTVEYWMSFYSMYNWHEEPTHDYLVQIEIKAAPCKDGHTFDAGKVTKTPTCKKTGTLTKTCTVCGTTATSELPKAEHQYDDGAVKTSATSTRNGIKLYSCEVCGQTREDIIPAIFTDVNSSEYYASAVEWAFNDNVTSGTSENTFSPADECTRGQVLTFLWRAMGSPEPTTSENPFSDVNSSEYYYLPILWGVENGITGGTTPTTFSPDETCSYAHILTFIWRSQDKPDFTGEGEWYSDAYNWASDNNLLDETNAEVSIEAACPRSDVVTYLYRIFDEEANKNLQHKYGEWKITKNATCTAEGSKTRTCTECKEKQVRDIPVTEHTLTAASCTSPSKCTVCGTVVGTATEHGWLAATCYTAKICAACGTTEGTALGHTTSNGVCGRCYEYVVEPIVFTGSGDKVVTNINIPEGSYYVDLTHNNGSSNFIVKLYYGEGKYDYALLSNEIGSCKLNYAFTDNGNKAVNNGMMEVKADGNWKIEFKPVSGTTTTNVAGNGTVVTGLFTATQSRCVFNMTHNGSSNFIVKVIKYNGTRYDYELLSNEIGNYSGSVIETLDVGDKYYFYIRADGDWTIDMGMGEPVTTYNK